MEVKLIYIDMYTSLKYKWKMMIDRNVGKQENYKALQERAKQIMKKIRSGPLYSINHICKLD